MSIDQAEFRQVLGHFASGVTVVTLAYDGAYHGLTVSAFSSLSLEPPLVLICIGNQNVGHALITQAGSFAINILAEDGERLSRQFASKNVDKFAGVAYHPGVAERSPVGNQNVGHALITQAGSFAINILAEDGERLSRQFASKNVDKFAGVAYHPGVTGAPLLDDALAIIECRLHDTLPGGDHTIFVGEVVGMSVREGKPLLYYRSGYGAFQ